MHDHYLTILLHSQYVTIPLPLEVAKDFVERWGRGELITNERGILEIPNGAIRLADVAGCYYRPIKPTAAEESLAVLKKMAAEVENGESWRNGNQEDDS